MHFINEENNAAFRCSDFTQNSFEALLKFAAEFCSSNQRAHIESQELLVLEAFRHIAIDDTECEPLDNGSLTNTGFSDENRIVFGPARENLNRPTDFFIAANDRIKLTVPCCFGQIARIFLQRIIGIFSCRIVCGATFTQIFDGMIERLGRHARLGENFARIRGFFCSNGEK